MQKHSIRNHLPLSTVKTNQSTITRQAIAVCSVIRMKHANILCRENAVFLDVTDGIAYMYYWPLNGNYFFNIYSNTIFQSILVLPSHHVPTKQTLPYSYRLLFQQNARLRTNWTSKCSTTTNFRYVCQFVVSKRFQTTRNGNRKRSVWVLITCTRIVLRARLCTLFITSSRLAY